MHTNKTGRWCLSFFYVFSLPCWRLRCLTTNARINISETCSAREYEGRDQKFIYSNYQKLCFMHITKQLKQRKISLPFNQVTIVQKGDVVNLDISTQLSVVSPMRKTKQPEVQSSLEYMSSWTQYDASWRPIFGSCDQQLLRSVCRSFQEDISTLFSLCLAWIP